MTPEPSERCDSLGGRPAIAEELAEERITEEARRLLAMTAGIDVDHRGRDLFHHRRKGKLQLGRRSRDLRLDLASAAAPAPCSGKIANQARRRSSRRNGQKIANSAGMENPAIIDARRISRIRPEAARRRPMVAPRTTQTVRRHRALGRFAAALLRTRPGILRALGLDDRGRRIRSPQRARHRRSGSRP